MSLTVCFCPASREAYVAEAASEGCPELTTMAVVVAPALSMVSAVKSSDTIYLLVLQQAQLMSWMLQDQPSARHWGMRRDPPRCVRIGVVPGGLKADRSFLGGLCVHHMASVKHGLAMFASTIIDCLTSSTVDSFRHSNCCHTKYKIMCSTYSQYVMPG